MYLPLYVCRSLPLRYLPFYRLPFCTTRSLGLLLPPPRLPPALRALLRSGYVTRLRSSFVCVRFVGPLHCTVTVPFVRCITLRLPPCGSLRFTCVWRRTRLLRYYYTQPVAVDFPVGCLPHACVRLCRSVRFFTDLYIACTRFPSSYCAHLPLRFFTYVRFTTCYLQHFCVVPLRWFPYPLRAHCGCAATWFYVWFLCRVCCLLPFARTAAFAVTFTTTACTPQQLPRTFCCRVPGSQRSLYLQLPRTVYYLLRCLYFAFIACRSVVAPSSLCPFPLPRSTDTFYGAVTVYSQLQLLRWLPFTVTLPRLVPRFPSSLPRVVVRLRFVLHVTLPQKRSTLPSRLLVPSLVRIPRLLRSSSYCCVDSFVYFASSVYCGYLTLLFHTPLLLLVVTGVWLRAVSWFGSLILQFTTFPPAFDWFGYVHPYYALPRSVVRTFTFTTFIALLFWLFTRYVHRRTTAFAARFTQFCYWLLLLLDYVCSCWLLRTPAHACVGSLRFDCYRSRSLLVVLTQFLPHHHYFARLPCSCSLPSGLRLVPV